MEPDHAYELFESIEPTVCPGPTMNHCQFGTVSATRNTLAPTHRGERNDRPERYFFAMSEINHAIKGIGNR